MWAAPLVRQAEAFIASNLALWPDDADGMAPADNAYDMVPHYESGEVQAGRRGAPGKLGDFVAVHWRRGDRAFQEEMGIHGHVDVALTSPARMVQHVQEVVSRLQDAGQVSLITYYDYVLLSRFTPYCSFVTYRVWGRRGGRMQHTHAHTLSHTQTHTHTLSLSLTHTHPRTHTHTNAGRRRLGRRVCGRDGHFPSDQLRERGALAIR